MSHEAQAMSPNPSVKERRRPGRSRTRASHPAGPRDTWWPMEQGVRRRTMFLRQAQVPNPRGPAQHIEYASSAQQLRRTPKSRRRGNRAFNW